MAGGTAVAVRGTTSGALPVGQHSCVGGERRPGHRSLPRALPGYSGTPTHFPYPPHPTHTLQPPHTPHRTASHPPHNPCAKPAAAHAAPRCTRRGRLHAAPARPGARGAARRQRRRVAAPLRHRQHSATGLPFPRLALGLLGKGQQRSLDPPALCTELLSAAATRAMCLWSAWGRVAEGAAEGAGLWEAWGAAGGAEFPCKSTEASAGGRTCACCAVWRALVGPVRRCCSCHWLPIEQI